MKPLTLFIALFLCFQSIAQVNLNDYKTKFPELSLPFMTPSELPQMLWEEDFDFHSVDYLKADVTNMFIDPDADYGMEKYYSIGRIDHTNSITLVYLLQITSNIDGVTRFQIMLQSVDKSGNYIDSKLLAKISWHRLHEFDSDYQGPTQNETTSVSARIEKNYGRIEVLHTEVQLTEQFEEWEDENGYNSEKFTIREESIFNRFYISSTGQIQKF